MRIKVKNILLLVFQVVSVLLLFFPGVYNRVFYKRFGDFGSYGSVNSFYESFFTKLSWMDEGRIVGVLFLGALVAGLIVFIIQLCGNRHIPSSVAIAFIQLALFLIYSFVFHKEYTRLDLNDWNVYEPSFLFAVILVLLIAILWIVLVSNHKIKQNGIIEELGTVGQPKSDITDELVKYKELFDKGVITQEEFEAKKKQILGL